MSAQNPKIILHGDVQLLDWGESRAAGPWIKLRLNDPDYLSIFRGMDTKELKKSGHIFSCTLVEGDIMLLPGAKQEPEKKGIHGKFWQSLIASGVFRAPPVLNAIGSEDQYIKWIQKKPSVMGTGGDWVERIGEERCEAAHVLRVNEGGGKAVKSPYHIVPMRREEHAYQHQHGEQAAVMKFMNPPKKDFNGPEYLEKRADSYRSEWASGELAKQLMPEMKSRSEVSPDLVWDWFEGRDLCNYLPQSVRPPIGIEGEVRRFLDMTK